MYEKDSYGYEMSQEIANYSEGFLSIPKAAIYMAMYRLISKDHAADRWEVVGGEKSRISNFFFRWSDFFFSWSAINFLDF